MSEIGSNTPAPRIAREGPIALFSAGREAFREVPGLRWLMVRGFILLYALFIVIGLIVVGLGYFYVVDPISQWMGSMESGDSWFWAILIPLLRILLWLGQAMLLAACLVLSFLISLAMMSLWFEVLTERIVTHRRGLEVTGSGFTLGLWLGGVWRALKDSTFLILIALSSLVAGLIPIAGPFLVIAATCYLLGWEVREPYLLVRESMGEDGKPLRKGLALWTIRIGVLPTFLAMVPILGWFLLPFAIVYQVAGVAWTSEGGR